MVPLLEYLRSQRSVRRAVAAGSYRRRKETIGDVDILVESEDREDAMDALASYERVESVVSKGSTRSTVILESGLHVDLRAVSSESFGAALHYFAGSKEHNLAVRRIAQERGLKVNEYGVFDGVTVMITRTLEGFTRGRSSTGREITGYLRSTKHSSGNCSRGGVRGAKTSERPPRHEERR